MLLVFHRGLAWVWAHQHSNKDTDSRSDSAFRNGLPMGLRARLASRRCQLQCFFLLSRRIRLLGYHHLRVCAQRGCHTSSIIWQRCS
ncbi:hypothetical protein Agabi119p4_10496 [Agaricus bisporus var. burnettii]|uniref:Uncharacterized protein n=1 Tax=Agaricus bisporus var. burnettii TaxID=192524 RepID=A0A8H7C251_AGABI|nr:hypothetical protein Agabi119p4_10496 [Agaricus bisporus var. burnettii]